MSDDKIQKIDFTGGLIERAKEELGASLVNGAIRKLKTENQYLLIEHLKTLIQRKFQLEQHIAMYQKDLEKTISDIEKIHDGKFSLVRGFSGMMEIKVKDE